MKLNSFILFALFILIVPCLKGQSVTYYPLLEDTISTVHKPYQGAQLGVIAYSLNDSAFSIQTKPCAICPSYPEKIVSHNYEYRFIYKVQGKRIFSSRFKTAQLFSSIFKDSIITHDLNLPKLIKYNKLNQKWLFEWTVKMENNVYAKSYLTWLNKKGELSFVAKKYDGYACESNTIFQNDGSIVTCYGKYSSKGKLLRKHNEAAVAEIQPLNDTLYALVYDIIFQKALESGLMTDERPYQIEPEDSQNVFVYGKQSAKEKFRIGYCPVRKTDTYMDWMKRIKSPPLLVWYQVAKEDLSILSVGLKGLSYTHYPVSKLKEITTPLPITSMIEYPAISGTIRFFFSPTAQLLGYSRAYPN